MNFLNNLTELLKEKNMSRRELAIEIGIAPSTINSWYSRGCENVTLTNLIKISRFFGITIDDLVYENSNSHIDEITFSSKYYNDADIRFAKSMQKLINEYKVNMEHELNNKIVDRILGKKEKVVCDWCDATYTTKAKQLNDSTENYFEIINKINNNHYKNLDKVYNSDIKDELEIQLNTIRKYLSDNIIQLRRDKE